MMAKKLKEQMKSRRSKVRGTLKDISILIECVKQGDYEEVQKTDLYIKHGGEYCEYLSLIRSEIDVNY